MCLHNGRRKIIYFQALLIGPTQVNVKFNPDGDGPGQVQCIVVVVTAHSYDLIFPVWQSGIE